MGTERLSVIRWNLTTDSNLLLDTQNSKPGRRRIRVSRESRAVVVSLLIHLGALWLLWLFVMNLSNGLGNTVSLSASQSSGDAVFELADAMESADQEFDLAVEPVADTLVNLDVLDAVYAEVSMQDLAGGGRQERGDESSVKFFGTEAYGNRFVYILDVSYSMDARNEQRYRRACDELIRSVSRLRDDQLFYVYVFCWDTDDMFGDRSSDYVHPTADNLERLQYWIKYKALGAGTDPRRALAKAFHRDPDAVFFLTDGDFNSRSGRSARSGWIDAQGNPFSADVLTGIKTLYRNVPIHAVAYENPFTKETMQQIGAMTGGTSRYVKTASLEPVEYQDFDRQWKRMNQYLQAIDRFEKSVSRASVRTLEKQRRALLQFRIQRAEAYLRDGELAFAEKFIRGMPEPEDRTLSPRFKRIQEILGEELGTVRLEDFERPPADPNAG